jgi:hypothetical protein
MKHISVSMFFEKQFCSKEDMKCILLTHKILFEMFFFLDKINV